MKNGELLARAADAGIQVFLTKDESVEFQQNLAESSLGIVVLVAPSHDIEIICPLMPAALDAIASVQPGQVIQGPKLLVRLAVAPDLSSLRPLAAGEQPRSLGGQTTGVGSVPWS